MLSVSHRTKHNHIIDGWIHFVLNTKWGRGGGVSTLHWQFHTHQKTVFIEKRREWREDFWYKHSSGVEWQDKLNTLAHCELYYSPDAGSSADVGFLWTKTSPGLPKHRRLHSCFNRRVNCEMALTLCCEQCKRLLVDVVVKKREPLLICMPCVDTVHIILIQLLQRRL